MAAAAAAAAAALPEGEGGQPVDVQDTGAGRVWRVALGSGRHLALKLASAQAPLGGELRTLRWLAQREAPVPAVLAADGAPEPGWLALEWCGDRTLDDALQGAAVGVTVAASRGGRTASAWCGRWRPWRGPSGPSARAPGAGRSGPSRSRRSAAQAAPWLAAAPGALDWLLRRP